ncbi:MAG: phosphoprotein [Tomato alphanucleorhabdovirus 1]|uniref:Phosphoprotein n=1 Tax=Tomato alphanucleorhabdovirus 1 TaxID=2950883 RepID=A0AAE9SGV0_9RHAB|nr:MAG: phosphoprotein [Tomato alphanucleorhabdovirus 1]
MNKKLSRSEERAASKPYTRAEKRQKVSSPSPTSSPPKESKISPQAISDRINNSDKYEGVIPGSLQDFVPTSPEHPESPTTMPPIAPDQKMIQDILSQLKKDGASASYESVTTALERSNFQNTENSGLYESRAVLWYSAGYNDAIRSSEVLDSAYAKKQLPNISAGLLSSTNTLGEIVQKFDEVYKKYNQKTSVNDLNDTEIINFCLSAYEGKSQKEKASSIMMYLNSYIGYSSIYTDVSNPRLVEGTFMFMKTLDPIAIAVMTTLGEARGSMIVGDRVEKDKKSFSIHMGKRRV